MNLSVSQAWQETGTAGEGRKPWDAAPEQRGLGAAAASGCQAPSLWLHSGRSGPSPAHPGGGGGECAFGEESKPKDVGLFISVNTASALYLIDKEEAGLSHLRPNR